MLSILYDIIIQPLVYLIELVFSLGYRITDSAGMAVIGVSLVVNLLCLPLYRMADAAQDAEREKQAGMKTWIDHINAHFSGDERVMMTQAYYRLQHYHPARALISSLSLLLQIPFFIAAYSYLSNLSMLRGVSFLFLPNLGAPDALITIGGFSVNVMPVLMTALNCVSTAVYTRGLPFRDKLQAYGLAAVFLVLLYDSPSGLVFYWTCNQLFSLGKNIFMKVVPNPRKWALLLAQACVVAAAGWLVVTGKVTSPRRAAFVLVGLLAFEAVWVKAFRPAPDKAGQSENDTEGWRLATRQFIAGGALLTVLLGILIPSALIADSPTEFMVGSASPLQYLLHTACVWGGVFLLWWGTFFALSDGESRKAHALVLWLLCGVCLLDYFAFGRGLGEITTALKYDGGVKYPLQEQLVNLAAIVALGAAMFAAWRWKRTLVLPITCVLALSLTAMSALNVYGIHTAVSEAQVAQEQSESRLFLPDGTPRQIFHLSRTEQNVMVIFLDRAMSAFLPYIMAERPELEAQFDGFVYYPNTISHGQATNFGAPGLYGGYEYIPSAMNERSDETLRDKHNEAVMLMPTLMSEAGFQTTVVDPPYAGNYQWEIDLSIYDDLPNTEAYDIGGAYVPYVQDKLGIGSASDLDRKFVFYAMFKAAPELVQRRLYDKGRYLTAEKGTYTKRSLVNELTVLEILPELTDVNSDRGGFVLLANCTAHDEDYLQLPDYTMARTVNNEGLEDYSRFVLGDRALNNMDRDYERTHYHVNAAALLRMGKWFEWMQEQGVWDNTRIIIVADHGRNLSLYDEWKIDDVFRLEMVTPLLMVKDFNATGFTTSNEFMTNADVPALALEGVVDNPVNPFTGQPITTDAKNEEEMLVTASANWRTGDNDGYTFNTSDAPWYSVHDDIYDRDNWTRYETYEEAAREVSR